MKKAGFTTVSISSPLLLVLLIIPGTESLSDPQSGYPLFLHNCSKEGKFTPNSLYQYSLFNLLSNFSSHAAAATAPSTGFYYSTMGKGSSQVYASYLCRGDITPATCSQCVSKATQAVVTTCPYQLGAAVWYIECMFQYSNEPYWGLIQDGFSLKAFNESRNVTARDVARYARELDATLEGLSVLAANDSMKGRMYATEVAELLDVGKMYTQAQCRADLSREDCVICLKECIGNVTRGKIGGLVTFPSCNLRFETYRFYSLPTESGTLVTPKQHAEKSRRRSTVILIALIISAVTVVAFLSSGILIFVCRRKTHKNSYASGDLQEIATAESLQFDFNKIRASTDNFSFERKLGQGGFGPVYKGRLENGQEIAVKRLSKNSGQGIREFKNEILLVAKLQHRNLVKLIGFCISGEEIALVYEYLPNSSLDRFLSVPSKKEHLDWQTRFKIICGIAKGLLYLHDDSRLKIIHRDLKSSNILLDEAMNPKISDFGLARLFGVDQTQDDTKRIVGTYGYMAPEYAMTGHFSTKSDVYSFGIIILEIVSGQKNRFYTRPHLEEALLLRALKLWSEGRALDLVDSSLDNHFSSEEVNKCIHIGLLCIQEDPIKRPNMSSIVASFSGEYITLPSPVPPNFFTSSSASTSSSYSSGTPHGPHRTLRECMTSFSGTENITDVSPR